MNKTNDQTCWPETSTACPGLASDAERLEGLRSETTAVVTGNVRWQQHKLRYYYNGYCHPTVCSVIAQKNHGKKEATPMRKNKKLPSVPTSGLRNIGPVRHEYLKSKSGSGFRPKWC